MHSEWREGGEGMSANAGGGQAKKSVSPGIIAVAVFALILIVAGLGYVNLRGPERPRVPEQHNPFADWIRQKAVESRGDIHNLSPADQAKLQGPTMGRGEHYLKYYYEQSQQSHK
jgi:hypothetical protein